MRDFPLFSGLAGLVLSLIVLGLSLVWINIERTDLAYTLRKMETTLEDKKGFISKLEVERDNLLTPARLKGIGREYGLAEARSGQIRRMTLSEQP